MTSHFLFVLYICQRRTTAAAALDSSDEEAALPPHEYERAKRRRARAGIEIRDATAGAAPAAAARKVQWKQSLQLPPVHDAVEQLAARGWVQWKSEGRGDCSLLSMMAGKEILDKAKVRVVLIW